MLELCSGRRTISIVGIGRATRPVTCYYPPRLPPPPPALLYDAVSEAVTGSSQQHQYNSFSVVSSDLIMYFFKSQSSILIGTQGPSENLFDKNDSWDHYFNTCEVRKYRVGLFDWLTGAA